MSKDINCLITTMMISLVQQRPNSSSKINITPNLLVVFPFYHKIIDG